MEVLIHPFSFREALHHSGEEPTTAWDTRGLDERAAIDAALRRYLTVDGFPEALGIAVLDRTPLLEGYVDRMLLRDVIERHHVTNVEALRRLQRHLLANPAGPFSVSEFHRDLESQALAVAEETLPNLLGHPEEAFMVRLVSMHTASERQPMRNPRKVYAVGSGLIPVFERAGRENRVLQATADEYPEARPLLLTLDPTPPARALSRRLAWLPVSRWLLGGAWTMVTAPRCTASNAPR